MIAIAGAKGGCGKTTTTLGLTEAVARTGTAALAVDADRQLPNLHVTGDVDREPTLATLESVPEADGADVASVAQASPRAERARIVPAPEPSETVDLEAKLGALSNANGQTFVDCPSGAGPDAVEPLSVADGVVVVTTADERCVDATEKTVEMARRLETPVIGVVLNRCETVPSAVESWLDVPVLGLIPKADAPLVDDASRQAYEEIVERLRTRRASVREPPTDVDLLATGIDPLDRRLGGGLRPGTLVALVANPATQSEQCLYETTAPRGTLYVSTERSPATVRRAIDTTSVETGTPTIRRISGKNALTEAETLLAELPDGATLLVDPVAGLERRGRTPYVDFLNALKERLVETGSIGICHCLSRETAPTNRPTTLHAADVVLELRTDGVDPVADEEPADGRHRLAVRKFRADAAVSGSIGVTFGDRSPVPLEPSADTS